MSSVLNEAVSVMKDADLLFSKAEVNQAMDKLAQKISSDLASTDPLALCVMNGGLVFSGQLLTRLNFPLEQGYLHASRYGQRLSGAELEWKHKPALDLQGRTVLLLDDILDEGYTLKALVDWCYGQGASAVKVAVLINKQHDRKAYADFVVDYCGLECPDRYVFGYGMDYKGYWRNAEGIYAVQEQVN